MGYVVKEKNTPDKEEVSDDKNHPHKKPHHSHWIRGHHHTAQAQQLQQAQAQARHGLQHLCSTAAPDFQGWVQQGDQLLGADWLVLNDLALPPTYVPPAEAGGSAP